jgi:hypothetical protein
MWMHKTFPVQMFQDSEVVRWPAAAIDLESCAIGMVTKAAS